MLVLFSFIDDSGISAKGFMFKSLCKLIEFVLLSLHIYFWISKEEYFRKDSIFQPNASHPFIIVALPYEEDGNDNFGLEDKFEPLRFG